MVSGWVKVGRAVDLGCEIALRWEGSEGEI